MMAVLAAAYLLPSIIGWRRHHQNLAALIAFNILLGWTIVGWALALVWSLMRGPASVDRR